MREGAVLFDIGNNLAAPSTSRAAKPRSSSPTCIEEARAFLAALGVSPSVFRRPTRRGRSSSAPARRLLKIPPPKDLGLRNVCSQLAFSSVAPFRSSSSYHRSWCCRAKAVLTQPRHIPWNAPSVPRVPM